MTNTPKNNSSNEEVCLKLRQVELVFILITSMLLACVGGLVIVMCVRFDAKPLECAGMGVLFLFLSFVTIVADREMVLYCSAIRERLKK